MAETTGYYQAAYVVAGVLYLAYAVSLIVRRRRVRRRLEQFEHADDAR